MTCVHLNNAHVLMCTMMLLMRCAVCGTLQEETQEWYEYAEGQVQMDVHCIVNRTAKPRTTLKASSPLERLALLYKAKLELDNVHQRPDSMK